MAAQAPTAPITSDVPPPAGAVAVTVAVAAVAAAPPAAAARPERTRRGARAAMAAAIFALGCAAVALAMFAFAVTTLHPADSRGVECAPTDAAAEMLLMAASAQVLASTVAMLVLTTGLFVFLALALGMLTAYRATDVAWMLVACHGGLRGALAFHYWLFYAVLLAALLAGCLFVAKRAIR